MIEWSEFCWGGKDEKAEELKDADDAGVEKKPKGFKWIEDEDEEGSTEGDEEEGEDE